MRAGEESEPFSRRSRRSGARIDPHCLAQACPGKYANDIQLRKVSETIPTQSVDEGQGSCYSERILYLKDSGRLENFLPFATLPASYPSCRVFRHFH